MEISGSTEAAVFDVLGDLHMDFTVKAEEGSGNNRLGLDISLPGIMQMDYM